MWIQTWYCEGMKGQQFESIEFLLITKYDI